MRTPSLRAAFLALFVCIAFSVVAGLLILHGSDDQRNHVTVNGQRINLTADEQAGRMDFAQKCGACHQLAAANSIGVTGPDLDYVQPTAAEVAGIIENGSVGAYGDMPANLATGPQIADIADYVSKVANRKNYKP